MAKAMVINGRGYPVDLPSGAALPTGATLEVDDTDETFAPLLADGRLLRLDQFQAAAAAETAEGEEADEDDKTGTRAHRAARRAHEE